MLFEAPTPSPLPTVTVTQTVIVPSSVPTPVITIAPPVDTIDPWKDVVWGNFGSAIVAALVAVLAVFLANYLTGRGSRRTRAEELRVTFANQFLDMVSTVTRTCSDGDGPALAREAGIFNSWRVRMAYMYGDTEEHRDFVSWLEAEMKTLYANLLILAGNIAIDQVKPGLLNEVSSSLSVVEGSTIKWLRMKPKRFWRKPEKWEPDLRARQEWEALQKNEQEQNLT